MATGSERYRSHAVWETLTLKQESLAAARFGDAHSEQWREDIVEWLGEAKKSRLTRQPALYLQVLESLSTALNDLPVTTSEFAHYVSGGHGRQQGVSVLHDALRKLPLPPPKELGASYSALLDKEVEVRTALLEQLESRIGQTETALKIRQDELAKVSAELESLSTRIQAERQAIADVSASVREQIDRDWGETLAGWFETQKDVDSKNNAEALEHVATLAATARAGEALAEHAAGSLSATDWNGRARRERKAAQWMRAGAAVAFVFAGAIGWFIVTEAIRNNFDLDLSRVPWSVSV